MTELSPMRSDVLAFLRARRSHPSVTMSAPGPADDELEGLLTIAARVPDHGKLAPWRFVVFRQDTADRIGEQLASLAQEREGELDAARRFQEQTRFKRAPLVVGVISSAAVHPKIPIWEQQLSVGAVCMNLVTAASAAGYAAQWLTEWYSYDLDASRFLGCRDGERIAGFIHIGTPTQPPVERARPDLKDIVTIWSED